MDPGGIDAVLGELGAIGEALDHAEVDLEELDRTWAVNVRATLLLVQAFARQYTASPHGGRVVFPYATTKGVLHQQ
jgi:3-oxoacyl-[acyl-carrier protein] reductase